MKYFLVSLLIMANSSSYAMGSKKPTAQSRDKPQSKMKPQFEHYECKAKVLPISADYIVTDDNVKIELTFEKDLKGFQIFNARGIDGLEVANFLNTEAKDVQAKEKQLLNFEYNKQDGLAYLVLELKAKINGVSKTQIMTIPVGEQSREQINANKENIVTQGPTSLDQSERKSDSKKKIHRMRMEKSE